MKKRTFHITVLLLFVAVLPSYAAPPQQQTQPSDLEVLSAFENAIAKVVDQSKPAVVSLSMEKAVGEDNNTQSGGGSGFIFDQSGYILTNAHVVEGAKNFRVELFDDSIYDAQWVGADKLTDIAVLKIEGAEALPMLRIADSSDVRVGQFAIAIGHPIGFRYTVTSGIVGGIGRCFHEKNDLFQYHHNYIQTDAWINPGSSGGPLLNIKGEVIGVTALNPGEGSTLAVDSGLAKKIAHQLIAHGSIIRGYFDAHLHSVSQGLAVVEVGPGTAAARSGLQRDDILVEFDGEKVSALSAFERRVMEYPIGKRCALKVLRQGQEITRHVVIDEMPLELVGRTVKTEAAAWQTLGLAVRKLAADTHQRYAYLTAEDRGILVEKVKKGSPGFKAKIPRGALITAINGQDIVDPQTLETFLQTEQDISEITFDMKGIHGREKVTIQL